MRGKKLRSRPFARLTPHSAEPTSPDAPQDEKDSFAACAEAAGTRPLPAPAQSRLARPTDDTSDAAPPPEQMPGPAFEVAEHEGWLEGRRLDVPPRVLARLRRQPTVRASLDLHGLTRSEARRHIVAFVRAHAGDGEPGSSAAHTVVRIIHGKGLHSPDGHATLRSGMAEWLCGHPTGQHVRAFVTALPEDGGAGAVYVLLGRGSRS